MKKVLFSIILSLMTFVPMAVSIFAQNPQTQSAPIVSLNAKYLQGTGFGYWPTAGSGLTLNLTAGTPPYTCSTTPYTVGTLTMTASATNYVYLNTSASCIPAVKTSAFALSDIPIAIVIAGTSSISTITDYRAVPTAPASNAVSSVFTRTGSVTAQTGDYVVGQVTDAAALPLLIYNNKVQGMIARASNTTGQSDVLVAFPYDSTGIGYDGGPPGENNVIPNSPDYSFPTHLAQDVQQYTNFPTLHSSWFGGGLFGVGAACESANPYVTVGSGWTCDYTHNSLGGATFTATSGAGNLCFQTEGSDLIDSVRTFYVQDTTEGSGTVTIGSETPASFTASGSQALAAVIVKSTTGVGSKSVCITPTSGTIHIVGQYEFNSTRPSWIPLMLGEGGSTALNWDDTSNAYGAGEQATWTLLAPTLVAYGTGINEPEQGIPYSTFSSALTALAGLWKTAGADVVLATPVPSSSPFVQYGTGGTLTVGLSGSGLTCSVNTPGVNYSVVPGVVLYGGAGSGGVLTASVSNGSLSGCTVTTAGSYTVAPAGTVVSQDAYVAVMASVAASLTNTSETSQVPLVDIYSAWGTWTAAYTKGWMMSSNIHPTDIGYRDMANRFSNIVLPAFGGARGQDQTPYESQMPQQSQIINQACDTNFKNGATCWTIASGITATAAVGPSTSNDNGLVYPLTGTSTTLYAYSGPYNLSASTNSTECVYMKTPSGFSGGAFNLIISSAISGGAPSGSAYSVFTNAAAAGFSGQVCGTFPLSTFTAAYLFIKVNAASGSGNLIASRPCLESGNACIYVENDCGIGSKVGSGCGSASLATNLAGGAVGSAPYQSAANTTGFIASPTTSGHTFVYAWQPSGSAITPAAFDLTAYLTSGTVTVVSAGSVTSTAIITGGGSQTIQTPSATSTLSSSGNMSLAGSMTATSLIGSGSNGGYSATEGTGASVTFGAGIDGFYPDSTNHCLHYNFNNTDVGCGITASNTATLTNKSIAGSEINSGTVAGTYMAAVNLASSTNGGVTGVLPVANGGRAAIANTTFTNATTAVGGNSCSASAVTVTMTNLATSSVLLITPSTDVSGSTGWGTTGGLVIDAWPSAANTMSYKICNQTSGSITPAAVTWNVGAQ